MTSTDKNEDNMTASNNQQTSTAPTSNTSPLHEHSESCDDPTHHHNIPSFFDQNDLFSSLGATKNDAPVKRKGKKPQQQGAIPAESIPGHRGNENIDDLVNFINSPAVTKGKKQNKKSTTAN